MFHSSNHQTPTQGPEFDMSAYPEDACIHERRSGQDRRKQPDHSPPHGEQRTKKERRRRIDPTTFEKQYTTDEMEFMNAMQRYKVRSGKSFPTYGEVLEVARGLGYRQVGPRKEIPGMPARTSSSNHS